MDKFLEWQDDVLRLYREFGVRGYSNWGHQRELGFFPPSPIEV